MSNNISHETELGKFLNGTDTNRLAVGLARPKFSIS